MRTTLLAIALSLASTGALAQGRGGGQGPGGPPPPIEARSAGFQKIEGYMTAVIAWF